MGRYVIRETFEPLYAENGVELEGVITDMTKRNVRRELIPKAARVTRNKADAQASMDSACRG